MARHKDQNWNLPEGTPSATGGRTHEWVSIHAALLMDIRDELKLVNQALRPLRHLECANFLRIPKKLDRIGRNTERKKRKPAPNA